MTATLLCDEVAERELASAYLAGTLSSEDESRFELHLLTCDRCQDEVRFSSAVGELTSRKSRLRAWIPGAMAAMAAAALIALFAAGERPSEGVRELGALDALPIYLGMPTRAESDRGDSLFAAAMRSYARADYAAAERGLRAALASGTDRPPAEFFLAAILLGRDELREAAQLFAQVVSYGETSYLAEARFYRAKALLRLDNVEDALRELRMIARDEEVATHAAALADSVQSISRR